MSLRENLDVNRVIYLDCHSTTPTDPRVLEAMLPYFTDVFGNPGSHGHVFGNRARDAVEEARVTFADGIGAAEDEIVFTGGATESNNLAIFGTAQRWHGKRGHLVTIGVEHPSVLEPVRQLEREGWRVSVVPVGQQGSDVSTGHPGVIDLEALRSVLSEDTALVSVSAANHEIGVIQPLREIAEATHAVGALLHTDATQAVGWMPVDMNQWQADLVSFSAHKFNGPKGVGALYVRRRETYRDARPVRLRPRTLGGGQEFGFRSGTLNTPGIVGISAALRLALAEADTQATQIANLRQRLWGALIGQFPDLRLHGPDWQAGGPRLPHNLNFAVPGVEGQTIILRASGVAVSSGSACSSSTPGVSTVLRAIGLSEDMARSSLRIGLGRFHTAADMDLAAERLGEAIRSSRR